MEVCLYNDVAFKWLFGRQERTTPLISLLNAVVGHESRDTFFGDIRIMNPFDISKYDEDKRGILDLRVREAESGIWADVEMQVAYQEYYPERSMFYLAGLYRDQMSAGEDYDELRPCHGIHILMADLLEDESAWYNRYRMMNTETRSLLSGHWNLHYLELGKFRKALGEGEVSWTELEQWCGFLSEPRDPSEPLDESFGGNGGIREVHEMLREFTHDERLREQYRLHEAWLRDQRGIERQRRKKELKLRETMEKLATETSLKKKAEKQAEAERQKAEKQKAERQRVEAELRERERRSVLGLREAGYSDERIAGVLGIPADRVKTLGDGR